MSDINDLKYKGKQNYTFLNITDSVKVFYLIDNSIAQVNLDTIYLSKNYGFVNGFNNYSLYSISELNIGNNHNVSYKPSIGDTVVWKNRIYESAECTTRTNKFLYELNVISQKDIDKIDSIINDFHYFDTGESFEFINNNAYHYYSSPQTGILPVSFEIIFREDVGLYSYYSNASQGGCGGYQKDDTVVYFKGKAGEFGDRSQLDKILSVEDIKLNTSVKIYPNPSEGKLTIDFENQEAKEISVIDNLGKVIQQINTSNKQLDLILDKGIYVIKVMTKNQVQVDKVLVE